MLLARLARQGIAVLTRHRRPFGSSPVTRGLEEFFEAPLKEGEERTAGESFARNCIFLLSPSGPARTMEADVAW